MEKKTGQPEDNTIHLGICMAGAVSAGAYTAGVIDYLLETFEAWEEAKKNGDDNVPTHNVKIAAVSGSSAGGIIGVMLPKILFKDDMPHVSLNKGQSEEEKSKNLLYNTWINFFLNQDQDILDDLLDPTDIKTKKGFHSLLNSDFKIRVAKEVLNKTKVNRTTMPAYIEDNLDVIVGITNASGYTYNVKFKNGDNEDAYTITTHRDLAHFVTTTEYDPTTDEHRGKFKYDPTLVDEKDTLLQADAARGTSAFPVGFIAEHMNRDSKILEDNELLFKNKSGDMVHPEEIKEALKTPDDLFKNYNLDSGTVNNEPFEHLRTVMAKRFIEKNADLVKKNTELVKEAIKKSAPKTASNPSYKVLEEILSEDNHQLKYEVMNKDKKTFTNTILLIDPLPNTVQSNRFDHTRLDLLIPHILDLLQNQARFKPDMIEEAIDNEDFTKFIIAPRREANTRVFNGYKALASGFLGAFGGFMKKDYLEHDFYLGRRNCQSFLQHYFVVELEGKLGEYKVPNDVLKKGYTSQDIIERFKFGRDGKFYVPIIPDMKYKKHKGTFSDKSATKLNDLDVEEVPVYGDLPKIGEKELRIRKKQVVKRMRVLLATLVRNYIREKFKSKDKKDKPKQPRNEENKPKSLLNIGESIFLIIYLYVFKVNGIARVAIDQVRKQLRAHDLYKQVE